MTLNQRVTGSNPVAPTTILNGLPVLTDSVKNGGQPHGNQIEKCRFPDTADNLFPLNPGVLLRPSTLYYSL